MSDRTDESTTSAGGRGRIVVGFDGSAYGERALDFAVREAKCRGADLRVVTVYGFPPAAGMVVAPVPWEELEHAATAVLDTALERAAGVDPSVNVTGEIRFGVAHEILIDESKDAELLVVGTRGRGELKSLLLGSVSEECSHRSLCPITIVH